VDPAPHVPETRRRLQVLYVLPFNEGYCTFGMILLDVGVCPWRRGRPHTSPGVECLKVFDIISGPDRGWGPGFPRPARRKNFLIFFCV
jgi:hypothetical protein